MVFIEYFGIDVGKGKSFIAHYSNNEFVKEFEITHDNNGFDSLKKYIKNFSGVYFLFEATGIYSKVLEKFCTDNKISFCVINPLEAKLLTNSLRNWKTDKSDAHKLAVLAKNINKKPSRNLLEEKYIKIRELTRYYEEINNQQNYLKNQLIQLLDMTFPELQNLFKDRYSKLALQVASKFPHPEFVDSNDIEELKKTINTCTEKNLSEKKKAQYANKLVEFSMASYPSVSKDSFLTDKLVYVIEDLLNLMKRNVSIKQRLLVLAEEFEEFKIIKSIPGIGDLTAIMIIGELGDIKSFDSHKQFNAYVGIDIKRYQSGKTHFKDKINKRGNKHARSLFYLIIKNFLLGQRLFKNHIIDYYYKLKKQPNGKGHKTASVACINKLLKTIHYLVINNKEYDYHMSPHG